MICKLINPSDAYTLKTDNFAAAAFGVAIVFGGQYGLKCETNQTPVLFGWDQWIKDNCEGDDYFQHNADAICDALDSILIGDENDRIQYESKIANMTESEKEAYHSEYHDKNRSSMNDIGQRCKTLAKQIREKYKVATT